MTMLKNRSDLGLGHGREYLFRSMDLYHSEIALSKLEANP